MTQSDPAGQVPIPFPEAEEIKKACSRLCGELTDLLTEKDHLTTTVIPNIAAHYAATIGARECERLRVEVDVRRLKRILEHIQAIENRGGHANLEQIEAGVEDDLREWKAKLQKMADEVLAGKEHLADPMSDDQAAEFRKLYHTLARRLHPDINPDFADKHRVLWSRVQQAYRLGNLEELRALLLVVDGIPDDVCMPNALELLRERRDRLTTSITATLAEIDKIKNGPPFALLAKLDDPEWVAAKLRECAEAIAQLTLRREDLSAKLNAWTHDRG